MLRPILKTYFLFIICGPFLGLIPLGFKFGLSFAFLASAFALVSGALPAALAASFFSLGAVLHRRLLKEIDLDSSFAFAIALISGLGTIAAIRAVVYLQDIKSIYQDNVLAGSIMFASVVCGLLSANSFNVRLEPLVQGGPSAMIP